MTIDGFMTGMLIAMIGYCGIVTYFELENHIWWWRISPWVSGLIMAGIFYKNFDLLMYLIKL